MSDEKLLTNLDIRMDRNVLRQELDGTSMRLKRALQDWGYYVRMTQWHDGFQVCVFKKTDIRKSFVSEWRPYENQCWDDAWNWANQQEKLNGQA